MTRHRRVRYVLDASDYAYLAAVALVAWLVGTVLASFGIGGG